MTKRSALNFFLLLLAIVAAVTSGCEKASPSEQPDAVLKRFYSYIAEGGPTALEEAHKLIDEKNRLSKARFIQVIKRYPPNFKVKVIGTSVEGEQANVEIEYKMESMFGGDYSVHTSIPLNLDSSSNTWKVDFTGESQEEEHGPSSRKK